MGLTEYIAVALLAIARAARNTSAHVTTVLSVEGAADQIQEYLGASIAEEELGACKMGLELLVAVGLANAIQTPHAQPRYVIESHSATTALEEVSPPRLEETLSTYALLGKSWLAESIENSLEGVPLESAPQSDAWSPLDIDRPDTELEEAIDNLSALTELVRADNGYAAEHPHERAEVLGGLQTALAVLRNAPILTATAVQVHVIWPMEKLARRFSVSTAIGVATKLAWDTLSHWLQKKGANLLDKLFS